MILPVAQLGCKPGRRLESHRLRDVCAIRRRWRGWDFSTLNDVRTRKVVVETYIFLRWVETTGNQGSWNSREYMVKVEKWRVGWCFQICFYVHSENWGNDPTWRMVFQMDWFNHQLLLMAEILHQLIGSLSHYLQGFIHPRWCRISSINSSIGIVS